MVKNTIAYIVSTCFSTCFPIVGTIISWFIIIVQRKWWNKREKKKAKTRDNNTRYNDENILIIYTTVITYMYLICCVRYYNINDSILFFSLFLLCANYKKTEPLSSSLYFVSRCLVESSRTLLHLQYWWQFDDDNVKFSLRHNLFTSVRPPSLLVRIILCFHSYFPVSSRVFFPFCKYILIRIEKETKIKARCLYFPFYVSFYNVKKLFNQFSPPSSIRYYIFIYWIKILIVTNRSTLLLFGWVAHEVLQFHNYRWCFRKIWRQYWRLLRWRSNWIWVRIAATVSR